jgi:hypothetical protein
MKPFCAACEGRSIACKGGGNLGCADRNPLPSVIAAILDTYGGVRFIVTHRKDLQNHVRHDELVIIAPRLRVHEPIAWDDIPIVIERAELEIKKWIDQHQKPNDPVQQEIVTMYRLRCLEHPHSKRSVDIAALAYT